MYHNGKVSKTYKAWQRVYTNVDYQIAMGILKEVK